MNALPMTTPQIVALRKVVELDGVGGRTGRGPVPNRGVCNRLVTMGYLRTGWGGAEYAPTDAGYAFFSGTDQRITRYFRAEVSYDGGTTWQAVDCDFLGDRVLTPTDAPHLVASTLVRSGCDTPDEIAETVARRYQLDECGMPWRVLVWIGEPGDREADGRLVGLAASHGTVAVGDRVVCVERHAADRGPWRVQFIRTSPIAAGGATALCRRESDPDEKEWICVGWLRVVGAEDPYAEARRLDAAADRRLASRLDASAAAGNLTVHDTTNACEFGLWHEGPCAGTETDGTGDRSPAPKPAPDVWQVTIERETARRDGWETVKTTTAPRPFNESETVLHALADTLARLNRDPWRCVRVTVWSPASTLCGHATITAGVLQPNPA